MPTQRHRAQRHTAWKIGVLLLVAVAALSFAGLASAQSSNYYQLGCWGVVTAAGGERTSDSYLLTDSVGQIAPGQSASTSYILRSGYIQPGPAGHGGQAAAIGAPDATGQDVDIYIPFLNQYLRVVYVCPY